MKFVQVAEMKVQWSQNSSFSSLASFRWSPTDYGPMESLSGSVVLKSMMIDEFVSPQLKVYFLSKIGLQRPQNQKADCTCHSQKKIFVDEVGLEDFEGMENKQVGRLLRNQHDLVLHQRESWRQVVGWVQGEGDYRGGDISKHPQELGSICQRSEEEGDEAGEW
jgi:hypothetical protein